MNHPIGLPRFLAPLAMALLFISSGLRGDPPPPPVTLIWVGDGVIGGTTDNQWSNWENWRVDGLVVDLEEDSPSDWNPDQLVPNLNTHVVAVFDRDRYKNEDDLFINTSALFIPNGAEALNVSLSGQSFILGSGWNAFWFEDNGSFSFETLFVQGSGSSSTFNRKVSMTGAQITLRGEGSTTTPNYSNPQSNDLGFRGNPNYIFQGEEVFINYRGNVVADYRFENTSPDTTITFINGVGNNATNAVVTGLVVRNFRLLPTQSFVGLTSFRGQGGGALINLDPDAGRLTNLSGTGLNRTDTASYTIAPADLAWVHARSAATSGAQITNFDGHVRILGANGDYSILLSRTGANFNAAGTVRGELNVNAGGLLEIMPGAGVFLLGNPDFDTTAQLNPAMLRFNSATVRVNQDLLIAPQGVMVGNATSLVQVSGNWVNRSRLYSFFDLSEATVQLIGQGTEEDPQTFEVHGIDFGAGDTGYENNFAIGSLIIGQEGTPTYVMLVDEFDFGPAGDDALRGNPDGLADALYLQSLYVHADSTLFIGELRVYVNEVLLNPNDPDFDASLYGPGLILVPEPEYAVLIVGLLLPLFWRLRLIRGKNLRLLSR